jgi:hypothetical protein
MVVSRCREFCEILELPQGFSTLLNSAPNHRRDRCLKVLGGAGIHIQIIAFCSRPGKFFSSKHDLQSGSSEIRARCTDRMMNARSCQRQNSSKCPVPSPKHICQPCQNGPSLRMELVGTGWRHGFSLETERLGSRSRRVGFCLGTKHARRLSCIPLFFACLLRISLLDGDYDD